MTEWIEWTGGECPLKDLNQRVDVKLRNAYLRYNSLCSDLEWDHKREKYSGGRFDIIAYRLIEKEQSDLDWLEDSIKGMQHDLDPKEHGIFILAYGNILQLIRERKKAKS